jgi:hypothetical protein
MGQSNGFHDTKDVMMSITRVVVVAGTIAYLGKGSVYLHDWTGVVSPVFASSGQAILLSEEVRAFCLPIWDSSSCRLADDGSCLSTFPSVSIRCS